MRKVYTDLGLIFTSQFTTALISDLTAITEICRASSNVTLEFLLKVSEETKARLPELVGKSILLSPRLMLHLRLKFTKWFIVPFDGSSTSHGLICVAHLLRLYELRH